MGNESSSPIDESVPPSTLTGRTISALAAHITSGHVRKIVVMTGAGISTSAGIPDFRSPETGLYANLARLNLPYAEAVFDIAYFRQHPEPFYALAHELYPGQFRPTVTHSFIKLLHDKGLLLKLFTQNIDCLEREAGVPDDRIVEAHGSFARQSCIDCRAPYPDVDIRAHVAAKSIPRCHACEGLVKPDIVFFGEQLPAAFFAAKGAPVEADLCIVMGTSLTVQPFASLPGLVREGVPRVLINKEQVGGLGSRTDDVLILGDCDEGCRKLADACGWGEELETLWAKTARGGEEGKKVGAERKKEKFTDEELGDEIERLTREVDETLDLSRWHEEKVRNEQLPTERKAAAKYEDSSGDLKHVFVGGSKSGESQNGEDEKDGSKL